MFFEVMSRFYEGRGFFGKLESADEFCLDICERNDERDKDSVGNSYLSVSSEDIARRQQNTNAYNRALLDYVEKRDRAEL